MLDSILFLLFFLLQKYPGLISILSWSIFWLLSRHVWVFDRRRTISKASRVAQDHETGNSSFHLVHGGFWQFCCITWIREDDLEAVPTMGILVRVISYRNVPRRHLQGSKERGEKLSSDVVEVKFHPTLILSEAMEHNCTAGLSHLLGKRGKLLYPYKSHLDAQSGAKAAPITQDPGSGPAGTSKRNPWRSRTGTNSF